MSLTRSQLLAGAAGSGLAAVALLGDVVRGTRFQFGVTQALALAVGLVLLLAATGPRLPAVWRGTALVVLNVMVLLLALDLASWVALRRLRHDTYAGGIHVPWYDSQPWFPRYRREFARINERMHYEPYLLWAGQPSGGEQVTVTPAGWRHTPGSVCDSSALRVMLLGGSTMWGVGAPDSGTIAFYLQRLLSALSGRPICTRNLGERAYVSTQQLIRLERELQRGRVPHIAVFYDGINDVINAWRYGEAGTHNSADRIERKLYQQPWKLWLASWHLTRFAGTLTGHRQAGQPAGVPEADPDSLGRAVAAVWSENCRMAGALGARYGFGVVCFLQPALAVGNKPLTGAERASLAAMPDGQREMFRRSYAWMRARPPRDVAFADLSGAFDPVSAPLYIDWYHVTPPGNEAVARLMAPEIAAMPGFPSNHGRARPARPVGSEP